MTLHQTALKPASPIPLALWTEYLAQTVSQIGSPPLISLVGILLCAHYLSTPAAWLWAGFHGLLVAVVPVLYIVYLVQQGQVSDLHLRDRAQRLRPLLVALAASTLSLAVLYLVGAPRLLLLLAALNLVQVAIFLGITLKWKISAHCVAASGLTVLGWFLLGSSAVLIGLSVPLIAWARVYLDRHTPAQTMAGTVLGSGLWAAALIVYGG